MILIKKIVLVTKLYFIQKNIAKSIAECMYVHIISFTYVGCC